MTTVHKVEIDLKKIKIKNRHSWLKIIPSRPLRHITDITRQGNPYHHSCYARNVPYQLAAGHSEYQLPWVGLEPRKVLYLHFWFKWKEQKSPFEIIWHLSSIGMCSNWSMPKIEIARYGTCSKWKVLKMECGMQPKWNMTKMEFVNCWHWILQCKPKLLVYLLF